MSPQYLPPQYQMKFGAPVPMSRFQAYSKKELDEWQIVLLYQDLLEAESLPEALCEAAEHFITMGLITMPGRALQ